MAMSKQDVLGVDCVYDGVHGGCFALDSTARKNYVYMFAKQIAKSSQHVVEVDCVKDLNEKVSVEND